ncbi:hypothetical protein GCM10017774_47040 [Lentzea cavernae]|uniref:Uncharacterized protein n=1 Tax=Lentzea cavernae TaxID=2020703 RepID=A0ABQ3MIP6_9PSEU|nr:hypothetical protein GCM10017774_47040 [Lentzea cavernae]
MGRALGVTAGGAEGTLRVGATAGGCSRSTFARAVEARLVAARGSLFGVAARGVAAALPRVERRREGVALPSLSSLLTSRIVSHYCRERP